MALSDWVPYAQAAGAKYGVDPNLLLAMAKVESGGNANAVSPKGAKGPLQFLPETAQSLGVIDPTDPAQAFDAAARLLLQNQKQYGSPEGAVLAYHGGTDQANWGPKTHAYLQNVTQAYQNLKAQPLAATSSTDAFDQDFGGAPAQSSQAQNTSAFDADFAAPTTSKSKPSQSPQGYGASIGAGLLQTGRDFVRTFDPAFAAIGFPDNPATVNRLAAGSKQFAQNYGGNVTANLSRVSGDIAYSAPLLDVGGEFLGPISAGAKAVLGGSRAGRAALMVGKGAAQGAGAAALTSGASDQPFEQQVEQGAELGAVFNPVLAGAFNAGRTVVNALTGGGVNAARAALANQAVNQFGIPLRGSQISNSPFIQFLDSNISKLPFSGLAGQNEAQKTAFTRAVASTFGESADALTPDVMQGAKTRIGGVFNRVANNTTIQNTDSLMQNLGQVASDAAHVLPDNELKPILRQIESIGSVVDPQTKTLSGQSYQALIKKGGALDSAMNSANPDIRRYAGQLRDQLDDALEASANPQDLQDLKTARLQYKNLMTVKDLATKAGIEGEISPQALLQAVRKSYKNMAFRGAGDIGNLADIGKEFLQQAPSSGTAERLTLFKMLEGLGGGGVADALLLHDPNALTHTLAVGTGILGAGRVIGSSLKNKMYLRAMLNAGQNPVVNAFSGPVGQSTIDAFQRNAIPAFTIARRNMLALPDQTQTVQP
jgi:hypothetical protein